MRKKVIEPLSRPFARAIVTELPGYQRVFMSGMVAADGDGSIVGDGDLEAQTTFIFEQIEKYLGKVNGTMEDVVRIRVFLNTALTDENYAAFNQGRTEFFPTKERYPASTVVKADGLVDDRYLVEIEVEALIPDDEYDIEIIEE